LVKAPSEKSKNFLKIGLEQSKDMDNKSIHWSDEMKSVFASQYPMNVPNNLTDPDAKNLNDRKIFSEEHELKTRNA
jgi:hypothetical protein